MQSRDDILSVREAAALLGISKDAVEKLLEDGSIVGRKTEDVWRTTTRALASYIDGVPLDVTCCTTSDGTTVCCTPGSSGCC